MSNCIQLLQALAEWALAGVAFYGINQWKVATRGKDQYNSLINIKICFTEFKKTYQDKRISILALPTHIDESEYPSYEKLEKKCSDQLWHEYYKIEHAINYYMAVSEHLEKPFQTELNDIYNLILDFTTSWDLYFKHISAKASLISDSILEKTRMNIIKWSSGNDEVSLKLDNILLNIFKDVNKKIKQL